ncbi:MAG: NADH-quinone oxidoreductase subunit N [Chlorobiaceae bacterium]|nr:NADH-quinone oxidoreductase subunit N [Chlorobiaceae bacterium]MBA4310636.1 NADH-quinone oxidoreductase subunit N [Chlorobiaceae bacterium]
MIPTALEFQLLLPVLIIAAGILISLIIEMFSSKSEKILPWFSIALFVSTAYYSLLTVGHERIIFNSMLAAGGTANIFFFVFTFGAAIVTLISIDYIKKIGMYYGEYYILLQSAVLGMMLMANAQDLVMIFMGLEQMSVCFYILAGFNRKKIKSNEAAMKYFLLGAFATGFIVYGIALMYGVAQTMSIPAIANGLLIYSDNIIFVAGLLLFIIGFSFKIAAVPFHMWVPDVYQGSPTSITALMSTGGKAAAFSSLLIIFTPLFATTQSTLFQPYLVVIATLSMLLGSIVAIAQTDLKRMLAYSSISHAGYILIGVAAGSELGIASVIFYLSAYTFMNLGTFGIISMIENKDEGNLSLNDYSGLGNKKPMLAALLAIFMFALAGIPPFAGFFGKYYVFIAAIESNLTWLAIVGVLSSVISIYFYLRVVVVMYFQKDENILNVEDSSPALLGIMISALLVIVMGIAPGSIINLISNFVK